MDADPKVAKTCHFLTNKVVNLLNCQRIVSPEAAPFEKMESEGPKNLESLIKMNQTGGILHSLVRFLLKCLFLHPNPV